MADEKPLDIFVLTGELSGDKLGYEILKNIAGKFNIEGVLGQHLKTLPIKEFLSMEVFNFMGLSKPFSSLYSIVKSFKAVQKKILKSKPKVVLLIDLPDINLMLAKSLRKKGFKGKIVQVVCPTIWAWKEKRKQTLEKYFDHLFVLFPFEKELFTGSPLSVSYIGHPLFNIVPEKKMEKKVLSLWPGSRRHEVEKLLPDFLEAAKQFPEYKIHISVAKETLRPLIEKVCQNYDVVLRAPKEKDALIKDSHLALSKNGTINLELALHHVPQMTCYRIGKLEKFLGELLFGLYLPHYSLPNILLKKRVIPELIGPFASLKNIKKELNALITSEDVQESMRDDYSRLSSFIQKNKAEDPEKILLSQLSD